MVPLSMWVKAINIHPGSRSISDKSMQTGKTYAPGFLIWFHGYRGLNSLRTAGIWKILRFMPEINKAQKKVIKSVIQPTLKATLFSFGRCRKEKAQGQNSKDYHTKSFICKIGTRICAKIYLFVKRKIDEAIRKCIYHQMVSVMVVPAGIEES